MKQVESAKAAVATAVLVVLLALVPDVRAAGQSADMATAVREAVRQYLAAIDAGDLDRQMGYWSADSAVTSVIMGEIWTGLPRIRARSAEYVPVSKILRNDVGEVTVVALSANTALAVAPFHSTRRDPKDDRLSAYELDSVVTLIWERTPRGWLIVHEHVSVKVPPPATEQGRSGREVGRARFAREASSRSG